MYYISERKLNLNKQALEAELSKGQHTIFEHIYLKIREHFQHVLFFGYLLILKVGIELSLDCRDEK